MSALFRFVAPVLLSVLLAAGCATRTPPLAPFTSDGCSLFPDGPFTNKLLWADCCLEHDRAYWQGGTEEERRRADLELKYCILARTGDTNLAELVYNGVRLGGAPLFPTWYRWGYGWPYGRPYRPLSDAERVQVEARWREFFGGSGPPR